MSRDALERLVAAAQALPQAPAAESDAPTSGPPRGADRRRRGEPEEALPPAALRRRVGELLAELARRTDEALPETLARSGQAWDQIDALRVVDGAVACEARVLGRAARALGEADDPATRALGLEAQLTIDAALDLASLLERRLATLVRLQLRAADGADAALLPDGKPFLDLGAALHETARRWA